MDVIAGGGIAAVAYLLFYKVRAYVVRGDVAKLGNVLDLAPREKGLQRPTVELQCARLDIGGRINCKLREY
jgi:hypothetical protein